MSDQEEHLRELGRQLPWGRPDEARRDALRESILAAAETAHAGRGMRWGWVGGAFAAGALAAAAVALFVLRGGSESPGGAAESAHAQIEASSAADFERHSSAGADGMQEIVRVHRGKLRVAVGAGVSVATADADVDGEGAFEMTVENDELRALAVQAGKIALRVHDQQAVFLAAGASWNAPVKVTEDVENLQQPRPSPSPNPSPNPSPSPSPALGSGSRAASSAGSQSASGTESVSGQGAGSDSGSNLRSGSALETAPIAADSRKTTEQHFQTGWQLLKAGHYAEAARELGVAADADGDLAADARYFQAEALVRAGRKTEAERALVAFLDRAPTSIRRGRAALTLARLLAERGDVASARSWFESATHDSDEAVSAAARAGLASLRR